MEPFDFFAGGPSSSAIDCRFQAGVEGGDEDHDEKHPRNGVENVDGAHHDCLGPASEESGESTVGGADKEGDGGTGQADKEGNPCSGQDAVEEIGAVDVGAEEVDEVAPGRPWKKAAGRCRRREVKLRLEREVAGGKLRVP